MADNATADPGSGGKTFATDEIAGVDWPFSKIAWGPRDTANEVDDAAGKRFPVKVGDGLSAGSVVAGQVSVDVTEAALPTVAARRFRLRALLSNVGTIFVGPTGVTVANGYPLEAGDVMPPLELSNLNVVHAIAANAADKLSYFGEV